MNWTLVNSEIVRSKKRYELLRVKFVIASSYIHIRRLPVLLHVDIPGKVHFFVNSVSFLFSRTFDKMNHLA